MSCASLNISRYTDVCLVNVEYTSGAVLNVQMESESPDVNVSYTSGSTVNVSATLGLNVTVSIVCTISLADGNEIWWCSSWRVLWDDGVKALWYNSD